MCVCVCVCVYVFVCVCKSGTPIELFKRRIYGSLKGLFDLYRVLLRYRVAWSHRMPYLHWSFSAKEP